MTVAAAPSYTPPSALATAGEMLMRAGVRDKEDLTPEELFKSGFYGGLANLAGAAYPSIYAHEFGHAMAARAVYQGANPRIEVRPFQGGTTWYTPGTLTEFGASLGKDGARALVAGAGTLVDATSSAIAFAAGYRMRKQHKILGPLLMGYAGFTTMNSILYAGTALTGSLPALAKQGNDFASLAVSIGLHPAASIAILACLLPAEYALLRWAEKHGI